MPNIAAFIAWGFITALFIEKGPFPVGGIGGFGVDDAGEPNTGLVGPMIQLHAAAADRHTPAAAWSTASAAAWSPSSPPWASSSSTDAADVPRRA